MLKNENKKVEKDCILYNIYNIHKINAYLYL